MQAPPHREHTSVSINPATGETIAVYPHHSQQEQDSTLSCAADAYARWRNWTVEARVSLLARLANILRDRGDLLATMITFEMGKPITAARAEVAKCAALCEWYSINATGLLADEPADVGADGVASIRYLPLGTILAVMPWNFPLWQVLRAAVPILAAGNCVILKHADNVQGNAYALADAFTAAAFPDGVFQVLNVSNARMLRLIADSRIVGVTVTAGVAAGSAIAAEAGRYLKKTVLELGGSDPFIVLAGADLDRAASAAVTARFQNSGQVCIAAKRIIVEAPIAAAFTERFIELARSLRQGDPLDPKTELGPLARDRLRTEIHHQVEKSIRMGAALKIGGAVPAGAGAYYPATVITNVRAGMPAFDEETFGPVAAITTAEDADHALTLANDSTYGLSGALWSANVELAAVSTRGLETGSVFLNGMAISDPRVPIGGVKSSGYGRELSHFGIREFCNAQLCWHMS